MFELWAEGVAAVSPCQAPALATMGRQAGDGNEHVALVEKKMPL